jgi:zinc-finger of transposase IS204/IS1001/IS1096/IS1165
VGRGVVSRSMNDKDLFKQALGVEPPWEIKEVRMNVETQRVEVEVECAQTVWADPETKQRLHIHGYEERRWRHLDMMQFETTIVAQVPRLKYPDGHTELIPIAWAEPHSRHTLFLKHGPSRCFPPAPPSRTPADSCGSSGTPLTGSWSERWSEDSRGGK